VSTSNKRVKRSSPNRPTPKRRALQLTAVAINARSSSPISADDDIATTRLEKRRTPVADSARANPTRYLDEMFRVSEVLGGGGEGFQKAFRQMHELVPRDPLEGLLVAQMANVHNMSMRLCASGMRREQAPEAAEFYFQQAARLMRVFAIQVDTLDRHRGKAPSEQRVTVEHVHVYDGGQAIVGSVTAAPKLTPGGGGEFHAR
jgi:hypothetical protein